MKDTLEQLKLKAAGKLKAYGAGIPLDQLAFIGDLLCSYVIEDGLIKQGVFTMSHKEGGHFDVPTELQETVNDVFGSTHSMFLRHYPKRGHCVQYTFGIKEG